MNNTPPTDQGDGWGFGDWTRFVTAWMKSKNEAATRDQDKTESQVHDRDEQAWLSSSPPQPQPHKNETPNVKLAREGLADDEVVRSSTDKLSAVFDWLIERVPAPKRILGAGSTGSEGNVDGVGNGRSEGKTGLTEKEPKPEVVTNIEISEKQDQQATKNPGLDEKELGRLAASYTVNYGVASITPPSSSTSTGTSEIKRRMDSEKANLKKKPNELESKEDLERFYVALTRKMYDEGL
jgi:triacylglycerol lipase